MASNFAAALDTWRAINLQELQKKLDGQGIEIVDNQKEGLLGRKALADKTKGSWYATASDRGRSFEQTLRSFLTLRNWSLSKDCSKVRAVQTLEQHRAELCASLPDGNRQHHQALQDLGQCVSTCIQSPSRSA